MLTVRKCPLKYLRQYLTTLLYRTPCKRPFWRPTMTCLNWVLSTCVSPSSKQPVYLHETLFGCPFYAIKYLRECLVNRQPGRTIRLCFLFVQARNEFVVNFCVDANLCGPQFDAIFPREANRHYSIDWLQAHSPTFKQKLKSPAIHKKYFKSLPHLY